MRPLRLLLLGLPLLLSNGITPLAVAQSCESQSAGCLPWGETVIGRIGSSTPARVSVLSGDGQTAMLSELDGTTARGASFRLGPGKKSLDLGTLENIIDFVVFTDVDDDGQCATGWYKEKPPAGTALRGFLMDWNNGGMRIRRRPDRLDQPSGSPAPWGLRDSLTTGIADSCGIQVGASRAAPQVDTTPLWGRIGMVWADPFPFVSNLPPTVVGSPQYLYQLDDAEEQSVDWPSYFSGANAISPNGVWAAGFSADNVSADESGFDVPSYPAVWNLLVIPGPTRIDWPNVPDSTATDITGDLLTFSSVGFTQAGASAQAWRAAGPLPTFEALGEADIEQAHEISISQNLTAVVPRADGPGVRFYPAGGGSFTSSQRLAQLGLLEVNVSANAVSEDGRIWGGHRGNDAVLVNTHPIRAAFLGDSYASGEGARDWPSESLAAAYESGTANATNACHRSVHAWAYQVRPRGSSATLFGLGTDISLGGFSWDFVACSGATTLDFFDDPRSFDNGVVYSAPDNVVQAARVPGNVDLIAFTIGGNDAGFAKLMRSCIIWDCINGFFGLPVDTISDAIARIHDTVRGRLQTAYANLRANFPNAEIFALGYPLLFELHVCPDSPRISMDEARSLRTAGRVLNEVIRQEALSAGIHFVPVESYFEGRNVCGSAPAINGIDFNRSLSEQGLQENLHPNIDGAALYAQALSDYLATHGPFNAIGLPDGD